MRKMLMMAVAAALMCGCEKELKMNNAEPVDDSTEAVVNGPTKKFTFTVKGDLVLLRSGMVTKAMPR